MKLLLLFSIFIYCAHATDISEEVEAAIGCDIEECQNGGICESDGRSGSWCTCPPGFVGIYCEKEETDTLHESTTDTDEDIETNIGCKLKRCQNGGMCDSDGRGGHWCLCPPGFSGYYCEKEQYAVSKPPNPCRIDPCQNGGLCTLDGDSYACFCGTGYSGKHCEIDMKTDAATTDFFTPTEFNISKSSTSSEYESTTADFETTLGSCDCKNGHCVEENGVSKCVCNPGYGMAEEGYCRACPCEKWETCIFKTYGEFENIMCTCYEGYEEVNEKCFPTGICRKYPCENDGVCVHYGVGINSSYECFCDSGYSGKHCEIVLTTDANTTEYNTTEPYTNREYNLTTDEWPDASVTYNSTEDFEITFNISSEYNLTTAERPSTSSRYGSTANFETTLDCPCENGLCVIDTYGKIECVCKPQYAKNEGGICSPCDCGQDADCEFVRKGRKFRKRCLCPKGYEDRYGYCVDIDECRQTEVCPRGAECMNTEGSYECICKEGYRPFNRTSEVKYEGCVEMCNENTCVNGECKVKGYSVFCKCDAGYTGIHCEQKIDKVNDNHIIDIIEIQSPWIILSALLLIIFLAFVIIHRNRSIKKNTFIFSSSDNKCPLFEDQKNEKFGLTGENSKQNLTYEKKSPV